MRVVRWVMVWGGCDYGNNSDRRFMMGACAAAFSQSAGKHARAFVLCFQEGGSRKRVGTRP